MAEHISSEVKCFPNAYVYTMVERVLEASFKKTMQDENHLTDLAIAGRKHTEILVNIEPSEAELHLMEAKMACEAQSPGQGDVAVQLAKIDLEKQRIGSLFELAKIMLDKCPTHEATLALIQGIIGTQNVSLSA